MAEITTVVAPAEDIWRLRQSGSLANRVGKYGAVLRMSVANNLAYWNEVLIRGIFLVLIVFIFVQLWHVTYAVLGTATVGGYTIAHSV